MTWDAAYNRILDRFDRMASNARLTLCGLSVCVDATISLHDCGPLLEAVQPPEAVRFADALMRRAQAGIGGELRVDWPDGPRWLGERLPFALDLGGTSAHAARVLTVVGAPALLALKMRSAEQLAVLPGEIQLAHRGRAVAARSIAPDHPNADRISIFEYTKGKRAGGITPPRSSRIIVRFGDPGIEYDNEFASLSRRLAPNAGAALLSGFSAIGGGDLAPALAWTRDLASDWIAAGIPLVHLELAAYDRPEYRDRVLRGLDGSMSSLGLSLSEFDALVSSTDFASAMCALGERFHLRRVCVHADGWSATATLDDPDRERDALLVGNLLASTRAANGRPIIPRAIPAGAVFAEPPILPQSLGAWRIVPCAAPYLSHPAATVGLGDTFTAGCLLVLGERESAPLLGTDRLVSKGRDSYEKDR